MLLTGAKSVSAAEKETALLPSEFKQRGGFKHLGGLFGFRKLHLYR